MSDNEVKELENFHPDNTIEVPTHEFVEDTVEMRPEDYNPEDLAASFFMLNHKRLLQGLNGLSKRQLIRVCYHISCMGLEDKKATLQDDIEKRCVYVMNEMITNRVVMQLHAEMEKANKAAEDELTNADKNDIIKPSLENLGEEKLETKENTDG